MILKFCEFACVSFDGNCVSTVCLARCSLQLGASGASVPATMARIIAIGHLYVCLLHRYVYTDMYVMHSYTSVHLGKLVQILSAVR